MESLIDDIEEAKKSFPHFIKHIYPLSFRENQFVKAPHTWKWAKRIQDNKHTATLSARKHLKSTAIYAFIIWLIFRMEPHENVRWLYMSYNQKMSVYHTENIKNLIDANPVFKEIGNIIDNNTGSSLIDYSWGNGSRFQCTPSGILTFNRGWHGQGVICDDILQDPTSEMNFTIIDKINRIFMEQVMSLPIEGGEVHLVGTAQHQQDLFFKLKENDSWDWAEYKAIINEKEQTTLWPELFSYKRLMEIRELELGEKAFNKEYMCSPVWSEEAYFQRAEIMRCVDKDLAFMKRPASEWKEKMRVVAGLDIGKKAHPSHFVVFTERNNEYIMIYERFMRNWDYTRQVDFINNFVRFFQIDELRYDDTRGEMESFKERQLIDSTVWRPIVFKVKSKFEMASNFSRIVNNKELEEVEGKIKFSEEDSDKFIQLDGIWHKKIDKPRVKMLNNQQMIDSILSVNNDLQAPQTVIGHGDCFWSIALALYDDKSVKGLFIK